MTRDVLTEIEKATDQIRTYLDEILVQARELADQAQQQAAAHPPEELKR